jgi:mRNA interferase YafQ
MYKVRSTKAYRKAYTRVSKHKNFAQDVLNEVIDTLARGEKLDPKYQDHRLTGELKDSRECHVKNNILLMYQKQESVLVLILVDLGTHDDLFN